VIDVRNVSGVKRKRKMEGQQYCGGVEGKITDIMELE